MTIIKGSDGSWTWNGGKEGAQRFDELAHAVVPEQCAWRVTKARRLVVSLRKADRYRSWGKLRMR